MKSTHDPQFDAFWQAYPRKVGKGEARNVFARAIRKTTLDRMLDALSWQRNQPQWLKNGGAYVPHPSTWLNGERWDDEPFHNTPQLKETTVRTLDAGRRWASR